MNIWDLSNEPYKYVYYKPMNDGFRCEKNMGRLPSKWPLNKMDNAELLVDGMGYTTLMFFANKPLPSSFN